MIPDVLFQRKQQKLLAAAPFTGAAPQTVNGNAVAMNNVRFGTLSARATLLASTATLTITAKWQGLDLDGNWVDAVNEPQNPAGVPLVTGTLTAKTFIIPAPTSVYAYRAARVVFTTGTAAGGGAGVDQVTAQEYYYISPDF